MANDTGVVSRHVSVWIGVTSQQAYAFMADVRRLPSWAAGLAGSEPRPVGSGWVVDSPMGQVQVEFAAANAYGVLDHTVRLPSGEEVYNPLRVIPDSAQPCEVVFTVRKRPGMSDEDFEDDVAAVERDLQTLKRILEDQRSG